MDMFEVVILAMMACVVVLGMETGMQKEPGASEIKIPK